MSLGHIGRFLLVGAALTLAGLTAACESDIDRAMREEREALKKSGELEKLEEQLHTTNPERYKSPHGFKPPAPAQVN